MSLYRTALYLRRRAAQAQRDALLSVGPDPQAYWRQEDEKHWAKIASYGQKRQAETSANSSDQPHQTQEHHEPELHKPELHENHTQADAATQEPGSPPSPTTATPDTPVVVAPPSVPEPHSMAQILDDISALIRQYLFCSEDQLTVLALWVVHTYGFEYFSVTPYLNICSPESQSGKTVCMSLLDLLCHKPWMPSGLTPARLISRLTNSQPTLLLDNWDTFFRASDSQSIVGFLNAGSAYGNRFVTRPDHRDSDESIHRNRYGYPVVTRPGNQESDKSIFCPKAFAGQGRLPASLADRCLSIVLQRRKPTEPALPFWRDIVSKDVFRLVEPIPAWLNKNAGALREAAFMFQYSPWSSVSMHQHDLVAPLRALAQLAGGQWPRKITNALVRIFNACPTPPTVGIQLLSDIRSFFRERHDPPKIHTTPLLEHLNALEDRPWTKKKLTPNGLRLILQNFPIHRSSSQRIGKDNFKGFTLQHFVKSWELYLPPLPSPSVTSVGTDEAPVGTNGSQVGTPEPRVGTNEPWVGTNEPPVGTNIQTTNEIPNVFNIGAGAPT
jgi:hypothetical protein